jgi:hypothetical protein
MSKFPEKNIRKDADHHFVRRVVARESSGPDRRNLDFSECAAAVEHLKTKYFPN